MRHARALAPAFVLLAASAWADQVRLKSGGRLEGKVVEEGPSSIVLQSATGRMEIPRSAIREIVKADYVPRSAPTEAVPVRADPVAPSPTPAAPARPDPEMESKIRTAMASFVSMQDSREALEGVAAIAALGAPAVPVIKEICLDAEPPQRRWLAEALGRIDDPSAAVGLLSLLQDHKGEVKGAAARALAGFSEPRAVQPLINLLRNGDWTVRRDAVRTLGTLHTARGVDAKAAVPQLILLLGDPSLFVRGAAHDVLRTITEQDLSSEPEVWNEWLLKNPIGRQEHKDAHGRPYDTSPKPESEP